MRFFSWCCVALLVIATNAVAHHSPAMFDQKLVELKGTVRDFQWHNPHCYIQLVVTNDKGEKEEWSLEMGAPLYLYNLGWRPMSLKPGDALSVSVFPLRNGDKAGLVVEATMSDGRKLGGSAK